MELFMKDERTIKISSTSKAEEIYIMLNIAHNDIEDYCKDEDNRNNLYGAMACVEKAMQIMAFYHMKEIKYSSKKQ